MNKDTTDIKETETKPFEETAREETLMKEPVEEMNEESTVSMGNGANIFGRKIGFGLIAMVGLIVVVLFFGLKSKITDYFAKSATTPSSEISMPAMPPESTEAANLPQAEPVQEMAQPSTAPLGTTASIIPSAMTEDQVKDIIKSYILNNPEVIMESLTKLQQKTEEQQNQASKEYINKSSNTMTQGKPVIGNKAGNINIVEFFDYQCIHCKMVYPELMKLMQAYPELKITLIQLPFMGPDSAKAVKFSMAVNNLYPDKFYDFHSDIIQANTINEEAIFKLIAKYGMNKEDLVKEANSATVEKAINDNLDMAQKSGVRGVPSFIINGEFIPGAPSYDDLKVKIDAMKNPK